MPAGATASSNNLLSSATAVGIVTGTPSITTYLRGDGTWATVSSGSGTVNSGTANQLAYYASTGTAVSGLSGDASINGLTVGRGAGGVSTNTAVGASALAVNTTGASNDSFGSLSLQANTTGAGNDAFGRAALYTNTTGQYNSAFGYNSLFTNNGNYNTAVGSQALLSNTTASNNTAVGYQAGYSNTTGALNVFMGLGAGYSNTTANSNTFIGSGVSGSFSSAGYFNTTGTQNTYIGGGGNMTTGSKKTNLGLYSGNNGGLDIRTASNYIVLSDGDGNPRAYQSSTGGWYQYNNSTLWSITSDVRIKKNVVSLESGLSILQALRPVEFDYIETDKHDIGFIAQEYQNVLPQQVNEKDDGMLSLTPNLVPYLVKAIQELKAEIDSLKSQLNQGA